jgi:pimeloyl-ACP methyl ester carboxylesterase
MREALLAAKGQVRLRDGRSLGYSAAGPPGGHPVLYMHGAIGSPVRRSAELESAIATYGLRYLMVDRPGFGGSDPHPGRTVASFAADVADLADALGLERFSVVGCSAGGPYALACAWAMPERVAATAAIGSLPPAVRPWRTRGMSLLYRASLSALLLAPSASISLGDATLGILRRHPGLLARALTAGAPVADRELLAEPEAREVAVRSFLAAAARGVAPMIEDFGVCARAWGFEPEEVRGRVHLWHGVRDRLVPVSYVRGLAEALPYCSTTIADDDGHFFFRARLAEILAPLVGALGADPSRAADLELAA